MTMMRPSPSIKPMNKAINFLSALLSTVLANKGTGALISQSPHKQYFNILLPYMSNLVFVLYSKNSI